MKRRRFLSLIGAAVAAPLAPAIGSAGTGALYSRTAYSRAVMHARFRPHVSARGIAFKLKVPLTQAEGMISEMAAKGLVKPVVGGGGVHVRAISAIVKPQTWGATTAARQTQAHKSAQRRLDLTRRSGTAQFETDLTALWAHLRQICRTHGMPVLEAAT